MTVHFAHSTKPGPSSERLRQVRTSPPWPNGNSRRYAWWQGSYAVCGDESVELISRSCPGGGNNGTTLAKRYGTTMGTQQSNTDISQEPGSALASAPPSRQLGIRFFPVVAFAVSCKPAETEPADKHREESRGSMNGPCDLAANVRPSPSVVSGNVGAPGQS